MQVSVLIESVPGKGFRATGNPPFALIGEGATRDEALRNLREKIEQRLNQGAEVVVLEIPDSHDPWDHMAGMFRDDPLFDEWQQAIAEYREERDQDPDAP